MVKVGESLARLKSETLLMHVALIVGFGVQQDIINTLIANLIFHTLAGSGFESQKLFPLDLVLVDQYTDVLTFIGVDSSGVLALVHSSYVSVRVKVCGLCS
ncbi:MAG: hypothetical protein Tsb002_02940 [Wenzhouxiangellaceae bacterium]